MSSSNAFLVTSRAPGRPHALDWHPGAWWFAARVGAEGEGGGYEGESLPQGLLCEVASGRRFLPERKTGVAKPKVAVRERHVGSPAGMVLGNVGMKEKVGRLGDDWLRQRRGWSNAVTGTDWIGVFKQLVEWVVGEVGDKLTVAGFMVFFALLWAVVMTVVWIVQAVGQIWYTWYGQEKIVVLEEVDSEGRDRNRPAFLDIDVEEMAGSLLGKRREKGTGVVGAEAEDIEAFRGRLKSFATKHPGRRGRSSP
ncbi:Putative protein of unknown function [Podospora comata]|uniref:Uncharacterized protein n=1 Tax=Podospora comata TaxID=48703 RepID=A0ABY6SHK3_PODCO|nr:Putative protein of unknown function [Podospora comata]